MAHGMLIPTNSGQPLRYTDMAPQVGKLPAPEIDSAFERRCFAELRMSSLALPAGSVNKLAATGSRLGSAVNRREFLTVLGLATAGLAAGCIKTTATTLPAPATPQYVSPDKMQKLSEVQEMKWKTHDARTTEKLLEFVRDKDIDIMFAAAEALALRADARIYPVLYDVYESVLPRFPIKGTEEQFEIRTLIRIFFAKYMIIHFAVFPPAREDIIMFLIWRGTAYHLFRISCWPQWQSYSGADFVGNVALREFVKFVQVQRGLEGRGVDKRRMVEAIIPKYLPKFPMTLASGQAMYNEVTHWLKTGIDKTAHKHNWRKVTPEMVIWAMNQFRGSEHVHDDSALIEAAQYLFEEHLTVTSDSEFRSILLRLLADKKRSDVLKQTIIAMFGNDLTLESDVYSLMRDFIRTDKDILVIAAARALRWKWKKGETIDDLRNIWHETTDKEVKRAIEGLLATIPDDRVFDLLLTVISNTLPMETATGEVDLFSPSTEALDNIKLWYVAAGDERNKIMERVLLRYSIPEEFQNAIISWLQDTSSFTFMSYPPRIARGWFQIVRGNEPRWLPRVQNPRGLIEVLSSKSSKTL